MKYINRLILLVFLLPTYFLTNAQAEVSDTLFVQRSKKK